MQGIVHAVRSSNMPMLQMSKLRLQMREVALVHTHAQAHTQPRTHLHTIRNIQAHTNVCKDVNAPTHPQRRAALTVHTRMRSSAQDKSKSKLKRYQDSKFIKSTGRFSKPTSDKVPGLSLGTRPGESTYTRLKAPSVHKPAHTQKTHGVQSTHAHTNKMHITHKHKDTIQMQTYKNTQSSAQPIARDPSLKVPGTYTPSDSMYMTRLRESPNPVPVWANYKYPNQSTAKLGSHFSNNLFQITAET
ncbi:hypothetical protein SARC_13048, partial [Sphaeroforma arctica JP610]